MNQVHRSGQVWSPVITPFGPDLKPDADRFANHCRWLVENHVGLAMFGTNSEATSLSVPEKRALLESLVEEGIPAERMMPGTGHCAVGDTVELTRDAVNHGCAGVLMLPPFYYKGVSDEGLFRYFSEVIQRVGDERLRVYLYHIPPVSQVPLGLSLIERLLKAYPQTIAGIKDSAGDWANTQALIEALGGDIDVYSGSEHFLLRNLMAGGAGCISATANVNPGPIASLAARWQDAGAEQQQAGLSELRRVFEQFPMIPALKSATALYGGDAAWHRLRPPLVEMDAQQQKALSSALDQLGFEMPGHRA
ncbi:dihydrodipicolinate synthase family protein [Halomonas sp. ML-15]|uniref:dihydrodipicolinate synthase family protein n=1 Tax=Halomonas sp. ML-15 TaxID=2773305 RepID=UPI001746F4E8|nr:dihydrodipicolinate synthase family protein [Halomonas sp. ML-15]MBD3894539.1 dihydrodipicolinate synthase family protein [Halomonas sp. ML-15]